MLIISMSVSVDGFIADREGAFGWTTPSDGPVGELCMLRHPVAVGGGTPCLPRVIEAVPRALT